MWQARPSFSGAVRVVMTFLVEGAAYSVRNKCGGLNKSTFVVGLYKKGKKPKVQIEVQNRSGSKTADSTAEEPQASEENQD